MSNIIKRVWNQNKLVNIEALYGSAFQAESGGHTFVISGVDDNGGPVALSGTVSGVFCRADNADVALTGSASNGVVSVTLPEDCYAVPGVFSLTIFVTNDNKKTAIYAAIGSVARTSGGSVAGPVTQTVVDLINAIEEAVESIPSDYSSLLADLATTYSSSAVYNVGEYVYYGGDLYKCVSAITTPESWTAAHWTAVVIGKEVSELKSEYSMTNSISGVRWFNGYYQSSDNAYVSSTYYKMSSAIPCKGGDKFIYHGNSSQTNRWVVIYYNKENVFLSGVNNLGTDYTDIEVTVPSGAEYMRVLAYTSRLSDTYIIYGNNAYQNALIEDRLRIIDLEAKSNEQALKTGIAFVDGSQETNGTGTESSPFNSINSAVDAGFRKLKVKAGVYEVNQVRVMKDPFSLELWSNASDYDAQHPNREKIVLFKGDILTPTISGGVVTANYTPRSGRSFQQVFVDRTIPPIDSSFTLATAYNTTVFLWGCGHKARRYEPVLPENYTGAAGTFTYQNGTITLAPFDTDTESGLSIYVSDDAAIPMYFSENQSLAISDVAIVGAYFGGLRLYGCQDVQLNDCEFVCTGHGDGLEAFDSNASLQNCKASGCAQDGYGFQYYGESLLMNCDSFYNGDDGVSHHKGTRGFISGGEYSYNGSGGITPAFGAEVDISSATAIGNAVGLQYFGASGYPRRTVKAFCCLAKDNTDKDIYNSGYDITFIKCVYDTEQATTGNSNTFYN